jgi:predicted nucleic acid-binding protein
MANDARAFVIDSSVFVAFYHADDSSHAKSKRQLKAIESASILVHCYVVQEVSTVLTYKLGKEIADAFLIDITQSSNIRLINPMLSDEIDFFRTLNERISFTDSSLILAAKHFDAELLTFDKQMQSVWEKHK